MLNVTITRVEEDPTKECSILEEIVLDCGKYYIGYSGLTINVYDKFNYMLIFSPSLKSMVYRLPSTITMTVFVPFS